MSFLIGDDSQILKMHHPFKNFRMFFLNWRLGLHPFQRLNNRKKWHWHQAIFRHIWQKTSVDKVFVCLVCFFQERVIFLFLEGRGKSYFECLMCIVNFTLNLIWNALLAFRYISIAQTCFLRWALLPMCPLFTNTVFVRHWSSLANDYDTFERTSSRIGEVVSTKI